LKYPLNNENLFPEKTRGISNEMTGDTAEIRISSGRLLCIHTRMNNKKEG
jgi:thiamine pyrophosphokinase